MAQMKKTLEIDDALLAEAKNAIGASTDTATIRAGLEALVRHAAYQRLAALGGSEPDALDTMVPRRREPPGSRRRRTPKSRRSAA
jgi:Arc/MetJ family transcription regulator